MGVDPLTIALIASQGLTVLGASEQADAAAAQSNAQQVEFTRQQREANLQAAEAKSDRALQADREFANMVVAMETLGGAGSQNEARLGQEIAGTGALDLARIEGNRQRQIDALQSRKAGAVATARGQQSAAGLQILGAGVDIGTGVIQRRERRKEQDAREEAARKRTSFSLG